MRRNLKSAAALLVCLSGWALVPFTSLPSQAFGWEIFAEAYGEIFSDGFETGDTSRWSNVVGGVELFDVESADELAATFRLAPKIWDIPKDRVATLFNGQSAQRLPTFKVEARRHNGYLQLRLRAFNETVVWNESRWRNLDRRYEKLTLEWQRSHPETADGLLYLSVDDNLLLWLVDLDNALIPLEQVEIAQLGKVRSVELWEGNLWPANRAVLQESAEPKLFDGHRGD